MYVIALLPESSDFIDTSHRRTRCVIATCTGTSNLSLPAALRAGHFPDAVGATLRSHFHRRQWHKIQFSNHFQMLYYLARRHILMLCAILPHCTLKNYPRINQRVGHGRLNKYMYFVGKTKHFISSKIFLCIYKKKKYC